MKILEINNKHYQECDVVMLPTDKWSSVVHSTNKYGGLFKSEHYSPMRDMGDSYQHLYILSDSEIEESDWFINDDGLWQCNNGIIPTGLNPRKVIATTDSSLKSNCGNCNKLGGVCKNTPKTCFGLLKIPQSFIEHYIREFNKSNVISKVLVEWLRGSDGYYDENQVWHWKMLTPFVNNNNEIFILTEQLQMFNFDINQLSDILSKFAAYTLINADENNRLSTINWIQQNLK